MIEKPMGTGVSKRARSSTKRRGRALQMGLMGKQNKGKLFKGKPYRANGKIAPKHKKRF